MTLAPVRVSEAADSMRKASTPEPFSTSRTSNWVARGGGLPDYIQHIAHDLMEKRGKSESNAIQMAIGIVKRWARGGGNVDAGTRAAAAKAVGEWEKLKAGNAAKGAGKLQHSAVDPSMADERAVIDAALLELAYFEEALGVDGMVGLLVGGMLAEAATFAPTLKRTASATNETERHEVYDGGQHVGTIARQRGYGPSEPDRHVAYAVNGTRVSGYREASRQAAIDALGKHLEEAPARVLPGPNGKHLVCNPEGYGGGTTYKAFSDHGAARYAAGLPPAATSPEVNSKVDAMAEALRFDLMTVSGLDIEPLRRVQEARRADPLALLEDFHPGELRGFHGKWIAGGSSHRLTPNLVPGRSTRRVAVDAARGHRKSPAQTRYEGGVVRASAKARAEHARKPQIALATDKRPEHALAAAIGTHPSAEKASKTLLAQPQMKMAEIESGVKAGTAHDTETLHRTGKGGTYSPERKALHEQIISALLQGKGVHEGTARAIFTAGGGASGKSSMIASGAVKVPHDAVIANPDVIREMLPEYKALKAAGREDAASLTHEEASHITKVVTRLALGRGHHVLVDGTGDSGAGKFAGKIKDAQEAGHKVSVHYATIPTEEAIRRADVRGDETGRYVDHGVLRQAHKSVSANFPDVVKIKGVHVQVFHTGRGTKEKPMPPELIAERPASASEVEAKNRSELRAFLAKAKEHAG